MAKAWRVFLGLTTLLIGALILAAMMRSNPDYNTVLQPFYSKNGQTRLFAAAFQDWQIAQQVLDGQGRSYDSNGVFLIVDLSLRAERVSTALKARWLGSSGREYEATQRLPMLARGLDELPAQPGIEIRSTVIFELPKDEILGGQLILHLPLDPPLEGALRLQPPQAGPKRLSQWQEGG